MSQCLHAKAMLSSSAQPSGRCCHGGAASAAMEIGRATWASAMLTRAASASSRGGQISRRCSLELCSGVSLGGTIGVVGIGR